MSIFHFTQRAVRHWLSGLRTVRMSYFPLNIKLSTLNIIMGLTFFNNKNVCPTSTGTGTLRRQPTMFHPINPLKSVPHLGHFSHKISQLPSVINLNVVKFPAKDY